jgi:hypothetical protein
MLTYKYNLQGMLAPMSNAFTELVRMDAVSVNDSCSPQRKELHRGLGGQESIATLLIVLEILIAVAFVVHVGFPKKDLIPPSHFVRVVRCIKGRLASSTISIR